MNAYEQMCNVVKVRVVMQSHQDLYDTLLNKLDKLAKENAELKAEIEELKASR
jgi:cell division protein FtsB